MVVLLQAPVSVRCVCVCVCVCVWCVRDYNSNMHNLSTSQLLGS
jgi:hypothetical protein